VEYYESYAATYSRARAKFRRIASAGYDKVRSYLHADNKTPDREPLAIGVASFGDAYAPRRGLIISGSQEGFFGSAVQIGPMTQGGLKDLPCDMGAVLVYRLCPFERQWRKDTPESGIRSPARRSRASVPIRWEPDQKQ
jgi:hypothetical protein